MLELSRWLQFAEILSIAASVVGAFVAVTLGHILYATVPIAISLLLNLVNRYYLEQRNRKRLKVAINRINQELSAHIQALEQKNLETRNLIFQQIQAEIYAFKSEMAQHLSQDEALELVPIYDKILEQKRLIQFLKEQSTSLEESLNLVIEYLKNLSLPPRVEFLEKTISQQSQSIATFPNQLALITARLDSIQAQTIAQEEPYLKTKIPSPGDDSEELIIVEPQEVIPQQSQTWSCIHTIIGHSDWVRSVAISPNNQTLISGSFDKKIKIWDLASGELINTLSGHTKAVFSVAVSLDGKIIASGSRDETINLWEMDSGRLINTLTGHSGSVRSLLLSQDGQTLISGSFDKTIKLWDLSTGELINTITDNINPISAIALTPDNQIASSGEDGIIRLWGLQTGKCSSILTGNLSSVESVAISPDAYIAAGSVNGMISLWQLPTGLLINSFKGHLGQVTSGVFSFDGQTYISGSSDGTIKIWHKDNNGKFTESPLQILANDNSSSVISIAISADGNILVSGSSDGTIKIWTLN
ncbi:MAG TPA: hypothetical protein V6D15_17175 [Oculatellaceae cyanobacterium]|jgi:uncharacterized coiled-coil protein SlyX